MLVLRREYSERESSSDGRVEDSHLSRSPKGVVTATPAGSNSRYGGETKLRASYDARLSRDDEWEETAPRRRPASLSCQVP